MLDEQANAAAGAMTGGGERRPRESLLIDVRDVAALLKCSARHVYRLADAGKMPRPVKLGGLVRWNRAAIEKWISEGCPSCRRR